jgi:hypothetical protein
MTAHTNERILEAITTAVKKAIDDVGIDTIKNMSMFCANPAAKTGQDNTNSRRIAA